MTELFKKENRREQGLYVLNSVDGGGSCSWRERRRFEWVGERWGVARLNQVSACRVFPENPRQTAKRPPIPF